ncbi:MAG TPA: hypothetical protein VID48_16365 [Solirubrobacteraceae bacterium]
MSSPKLTVEEASNAYVHAMRNPPVARAGVCAVCKTFHDPSFQACGRCVGQPNNLDAFVPITYSVHGRQMHDALWSYKNASQDEVRWYHGVRLTAILWRFIENHESCLARAAGVDDFDLVATVPSKTPERDEGRRGLRTIAGKWCTPIVDRWQRVLWPADPPLLERSYSHQRYVADTDLTGRRVLLIDDTWTSGTAMQSAAFALRAAGASSVAGVVIGRHLRLEFSWDTGSCEGEYKKLSSHFDWSVCALES